MKYIRLLLLLPAISFAGEVNIKVLQNSGNSTYSVVEPINNLKARLDFPIKFSIANFEYIHPINDFTVTIGTSFLLKDSTTLGEDFDWKNNNLTVYSNSENNVKKFYDFYFSIEKNLFNNFSVVSGLKHSILDFSWYNTDSTNYVKNTNTFVGTNTLTYKQMINQANIGIKYENTFDDINVSIIPSLIFANIENKDTHLLRNFHTKQNSNLFGFGVKSNLLYKINNKSSFGFYAEYEKFDENTVKMNYYNSTLGNYQTLNSSFKIEHRKIGLQFRHKF